jgi:hypothetical protein
MVARLDSQRSFGTWCCSEPLVTSTKVPETRPSENEIGRDKARNSGPVIDPKKDLDKRAGLVEFRNTHKNGMWHSLAARLLWDYPDLNGVLTWENAGRTGPKHAELCAPVCPSGPTPRFSPVR